MLTQEGRKKFKVLSRTQMLEINNFFWQEDKLRTTEDCLKI